MICRQNSVEEIGSMDVSFKNSSIRSSLCSLYKNYDFHLDILKITGVIVLLSIMSVTLAITSNLYKVDTTKNVRLYKINCTNGGSTVQYHFL